MRFLNRRALLASFAVVFIILTAVAVTVFFYITSARFEEQARQYVVRQIESRTGAKTSLQAFGWNLWGRRFELQNLTLRGLEPDNESPLAHFDKIDVGLNFRSLLERHIDLFELTLTRPDFHIIVGPDGKTNLPSPTVTTTKPLNFQISIENFNIVGGSALLNERQVELDFSLANIAALLNYSSVREVMEMHLRYDGVLNHNAGRAIPYTLSADLDYTRATLIAQRMNIKSGPSEVKLQGKISQVFSKEILGRLEYTGLVEVPFLNYFFPKESLAGKADIAGVLEFARGYFLTRGTTVSKTVDYDGWRAANLKGNYTYRYPERKLLFEKMSAEAVGGSVSGSVVVEPLPGASKVLMDLGYSNVDAAVLSRAYPWDPKYRIFSRMTGTLNGWFVGRFRDYNFSGHADLNAYAPVNTDGLTPLPVDGSTDYDIRPNLASVQNAEGRLYSTDVKADGLIDATASNLKIIMDSADLKDLAFLYADANGHGSFDGVVSGPISKPVLTGDFVLQDHRYREWNIQQVAGGVRLDTDTGAVELRNARITQGHSRATINGTTTVSGATADLRVESDHVTGEDIRPFVNRDVGGVFSGNVHITSLMPVRVEGDVRASALTFENTSIGDASGHISVMDPVVEIERLSINRDRATATGSLVLNRSTEAVKFSARAGNLDLSNFKPFGLPASVSGVIQEADIQGEGTLKRPNVHGQGVIQNLSVFDQSFPQARINLSSSGSKLDVTLDAGRNVNLKAQIDTATRGYPFSSQAVFMAYPLQKFAGLEATLVVTGDASLSGFLNDRTKLSGRGNIQTAEARVRETPLKISKPFTFEFNSDHLMISGVTLTGEATQVNLAGTIGFTERAPLDLNVTGSVDLGLVSSAYPDWSSGGAVNIDGKITGTLQTPDLRGFAHINAASFSRRGFFTSISNVNGDLFFDQNRMTVNNVTGTVGGGVVQAQGSAVVQDGTLQSLNIRIDTTNVRVRYPEGLRTVVDGALILRGSLDSPLLEGSLEIQNLAYRSNFEDFLALVTERRTAAEPSPLARLRLALHVEGGRNITIQNELANVEARIDLDIKGTVDNPSLTGHVEASGGTLLFQNNRYTITRGNIDFVDPLRLEPAVDVQAESQVRDYRIILSITGRGDKLRLDMRSEPPLPELEIVSLIAGGQTREEIASRPGASTVPTSEQLFQRGAASILSDLLQQRVGNRLGLFGLSRVRVEPFLVGTTSTPGASITLAEQVTKDLSITYSQNLSSNNQQVIQLEYFVSRNTSIVASRDWLGNFGLDVRRRTRF